MIRLAPGPLEIVDEVPFGRLYKDGCLLVSADEPPVRERRKLSYVGAVAVSVVWFFCMAGLGLFFPFNVAHFCSTP